MSFVRKGVFIFLVFGAQFAGLYGQKDQVSSWSAFWEDYNTQNDPAKKLSYSLSNAVELLGQDPKQGLALIDSLKSEVSNLNLSETDELLYKRLHLEILHRNFLRQQAGEVSNQLNRELTKPPEVDLSTLIDLHITLGDFSLDAQYPDSAIYHYESAQLYSENAKDTFRLWTSLNKESEVYNLLGAYDRVVEDELQTYYLAREMDRGDLQLISLHNLAGGYRGLAEYAKAEEVFLEEIERLLETDNKESLAFAYSGLSANYFYSSQINQSIEYTEKSLELLQELNMEFHQTALWVQYGSALVLEGRFTEAEKALNTGAQMAEIQDFVEAKVRVMFGFVRLELARDNYQLAGEYLQKAFTAIEGYPMPKSEEIAFGLAIEYYSKKQDYQQAFLAQQKLSKLKDSVLRVQKAYQLMEHQTRFGTLEKDRQIEQAGLALQAEEARTQRIVVGLIILLMVLLIMLYLIVQLKRSRDKIRITSEILASQKEQLEQLNKTKDKFFSIIAHDLRSPMVALQGVGQKLDFFLRKGKQDKLMEMGGKIDRSIDNLNHLLNNLLNWASNESNGVPNSPQLFSSKELILDTVELYRNIAESKNIRMEVLLEENQLYADRNMASTVIRNLLSNAIKFTPDSGQIKIETSKHGAFTRIIIADTGKGIAQEQIEHVFSGDISQSGTSGERGFGLGLKICKEFVQNMGGSISVSSKLNMGTTFMVDLPNTKAANPQLKVA